MMTEIVHPSLLLLSGICAYAAVLHISIARLRRPYDSMHILFAGTCVLATMFGLSNGWLYRAQSVAAYVTALKWNLGFIALFLGSFLWFIAVYTGVRPRRFLAGMSLVLAALFAVNLFEPLSLQFEEISALTRQRLPWGEEIAQAHGRNTPWFALGVLAFIVINGYALYAFTTAWRRERRGTTLAMLLAVAVLLATGVEGALVRAGVIDFVHLGPFGYLVMVIVMSVACSRETHRRMQASERRFRLLVEQSPFSIQLLAPDGSTRQVNPAWERLWGMKAEALAGYNILQDPQLVEKGAMPYIEKGFAGETTEIPPIVYNPADNPVVRGPVRDRWVRAYIYPIKDAAGKVGEVILMHEDVTERKRSDDAIRHIAAGVSAATGEAFFRQLVQSLAQLFDADYAFIGVLDEKDPMRVNTLAIAVAGSIADNLSYHLADTPCANVVGQSTCAYPGRVQQLFPKDALLAQMGAESYIGTPLFDAGGEPFGLIVVLDTKPMRDVGQVQPILDIFAARAAAELHRTRTEAQIRRMAYHDNLTGLANRALLYEELRAVLGRARGAKEYGAVLLIDLDHFKTINDALSHDIGDEVLRAVARRLSETVGERALIARLGGDEFVALIEPVCCSRDDTARAARELAQTILHELSLPFSVGERVLNVGASIGAVVFPDDGATELDILRHADMALYRAKSLGRGNIQFFLPGLQAAAETRLRLGAGLHRALAAGELALHYQPQINATGQMIGAEALLRWHHPEMGDTPPATFISIAEETGLIHAIGDWVLEHGCARLTEWLRAGAPFFGHLSVNVSPWQFARPDFVERVRGIVTAQRIDPGRLMLELTESALLYDLEEAADKLKALRALGLRVALDDFGTGYSSLAYLRDLPLDQIKIDKSFINELSSTANHPMVESMIAIGHHMELQVIAEGVETAAQRDVLASLGCKHFQGFLFCRPIPERDFLGWLTKH